MKETFWEDYREHSGSGADGLDYSGAGGLQGALRKWGWWRRLQWQPVFSAGDKNRFLERVEGGWGVEDGKEPTMIPEGLAWVHRKAVCLFHVYCYGRILETEWFRKSRTMLLTALLRWSPRWRYQWAVCLVMVQSLLPRWHLEHTVSFEEKNAMPSISRR